MNIAQTKQIDIVDFLKAIGCFPTKETACAAWFRAPYREDMTPSFKVNKSRKIWYDFGLARSGDIIDLGILIYRTHDISRVLKLIENAVPGVPVKARTFLPSSEERNETLRNIRAGALTSAALKSYLASRGIDMEIGTRECREIHYTCRGRAYFAIGFPNIAGGYELRSLYYKGCIAPKEISVASTTKAALACCLFEGFMDFLSYLTLVKQGKLPLLVAIVYESVWAKLFFVLQRLNGFADVLRRYQSLRQSP